MTEFVVVVMVDVFDRQLVQGSELLYRAAQVSGQELSLPSSSAGKWHFLLSA